MWVRNSDSIGSYLAHGLELFMLLLFRRQNYRRFYYGLLFDDASTAVTTMLLGWIVLSVTNSAFWVGVTAGMAGVGMTLSSPVAGILIDRYNRRNLLVITQFSQMFLVAILGILALYEVIEVWQVLFFAFLGGAFYGMRYPCRMAMTLDLVGTENLLKGTAASYFSMTVMGIVAPLVGGWLIGKEIYYGFVFIFLALLLSSLGFLNIRGVVAPKIATSNHLEDLIYGARYVAANSAVRSLIFAVLVAEFFGWSVESILPVIARDRLGLDVQGLGVLISGGALGAAISTACMAVIPDVNNKGKLVVYGLLGLGFGLIAFAFSNQLLLSMVLLAFTYGFGVIFDSGISTLLQSTVPNHMRGRVLSLQALSWGFSGSAGFHVGLITAILGAPIVVALGGVAVAVNGIRIAKNIVAIGAQATSEIDE